MVQIIGTMLVAALTGLTYLAYKHPKSYSEIYIVISAFVLALLVGLSAWNFAVSQSFRKLIPYMDTDKLDVAGTVIDGLSIPMVYIWGVILVNIYLWGVGYLHKLIKKEERGEI